MIATADPKQRDLFTYLYLRQGDVWYPNGKPNIRIADMDPEWRYNCTRMLERHAAALVASYDLGELTALSQPVWRDVVGELRGVVVYRAGPALSELDLMDDGVAAGFEQERERRHADPVTWIRTTVLYRALVAGLPTKAKKLAKLAERARHYSTCPARAGQRGDCTCHLSECAIRNGHPELACTCRDWSPE